jgi:ATP-dependent Clp protease protease subunit
MDKKELAKLMTEETWMSAAKAIELGFADGLLERETQPATDMAQPLFSPPSVLFSRKTADAALVNKLAETAGIPIQQLYERLEKLR